MVVSPDKLDQNKSMYHAHKVTIDEEDAELYMNQTLDGDESEQEEEKKPKK